MWFFLDNPDSYFCQLGVTAYHHCSPSFVAQSFQILSSQFTNSISYQLYFINCFVWISIAGIFQLYDSCVCVCNFNFYLLADSVISVIATHGTRLMVLWF